MASGGEVLIGAVGNGFAVGGGCMLLGWDLGRRFREGAVSGTCGGLRFAEGFLPEFAPSETTEPMTIS